MLGAITQSHPASAFRTNIRQGIVTGLTIAIGLSLIAVVLFFVAGKRGFAANDRTLMGVIATYCIGGLCIGAIGGALIPLMRSTIGFTLGAGLLGVLAYVAFLIEDSGPFIWRPFEWPLALVFAIIGIAVASGARSRIRARASQR